MSWDPERIADRDRDPISRARELGHQGRYDQAIGLAREAVSMARQSPGEDAPDLLAALTTLGELCGAKGLYGEARLHLEEVLQCVHRSRAEHSPAVAIPLQVLATACHGQGDFIAAEKYLRQAKSVLERQPERPPELQGLYAAIVGSLSVVRHELDDLDGAMELAIQSLDLSRELFGNSHVETAVGLMNLAELQHSLGNLAEAKKLLFQARDILRTTLPDPENHPDYAQCLHNIGELLRSLHDFPGACSCIEHALVIRKRVLSPGDPLTATTISNLAGIYIQLGRCDEAEQMLQHAADSDRKSLGEQHESYAIKLLNLAGEKERRGEYQQAESLTLRALGILRKALGDHHSRVAIGLNNLAGVYDKQSDYASAESCYRQAMAIYRKTLGDDHESLANVLTNLAVLCAVTGCPEEAMTLLEMASPIYDRMAAEVFSVTSEAQRAVYFSQIQNHSAIVISLVVGYLADRPESVRSALDIVLRRKGIGFESLSVQRDAILRRRNPSLRDRLRELSNLRTQIARAWFRGPGPEGLDTHRSQLADWEARKEALEAELAEQIPEIRLDCRVRQVNRHDIASALPDSSVLVEFLNYRVFDFHAAISGSGRWGTGRYAAFILPACEPDGVRMLDLGESNDIDQLIAGFRAGLTKIDEQAFGTSDRAVELLDASWEEVPTSQDDSSLAHTLVDRLVPLLGTSRHLILSPDGDLNRLPFDVLPTRSGCRLTDDFQVSYVSVGRDIRRFGVPSAQWRAPMIIADPEFNLAEDLQSDTGFSEQPSAHSPRGRLRFPPLPGTRVEAERLAARLRVRPLLGRNVLETWVKAVRSPLVLHIATHAFVLPEEDPRSDDATPQRLGNRHSGGVASDSATSPCTNPMLRSGLALGGANSYCVGKTLPDDAEDGILTSEDIRDLDLTGTELVVASACGTGLGQVQSGEGVYGLRRAFALAGARTLVMSLWPVSDIATAVLMDRFYDNLVARRLPRHLALRDAQLYLRTLTVSEIRDEWLSDEMLLRLSGGNAGTEAYLRSLSQLPDDQTPFDHPRYWGAFICQGDPSPLSAAALGQLPGEPRK